MCERCGEVGARLVGDAINEFLDQHHDELVGSGLTERAVTLLKQYATAIAARNGTAFGAVGEVTDVALATSFIGWTLQHMGEVHAMMMASIAAVREQHGAHMPEDVRKLLDHQIDTWREAGWWDESSMQHVKVGELHAEPPFIVPPAKDGLTS